VLRRGAPRAALLLAALSLLALVAFSLARPRVEAIARQRIEREAVAAGFSATLNAVVLRPWLSLELQDLVLENARGVRVRTREVRLRPRLSWLGLTGRAVTLAHDRVLVDLPAGLRLDVEPSSWAVESSRDELRLSRVAPHEVLEIALARGKGLAGSRASARAEGARLSRLLHVVRNGCPLADLGTADGGCRVDVDVSGTVRVAAQARARGFAIASLDGDPGPGCAGAPFGAPTDVEVEADVVVDPAAGSLRGERLRLRAAGVEATGQLLVTGGLARPQVRLDAEVPRFALATLLATAGLDLPASDLGSAALSLHLVGPLLEPAALRVSPRLDFVPPAAPTPAIERLKGPFVHKAIDASGRAYDVHVEPGSPDFVPLDDVPELFLRALLLGEDSNFWGHPGIDLAELPSAIATNLERGTFARGASTIAQQLAKNLFLSREKRLGRKLEEAALALLLDASLGRRRVLEIYVNVIEWGPGVYGLRPAARHYFGHEPSELTTKQMVFLVSMIPGPVKYQRSIVDGVSSPFLEGLMATLLAKLASVGALTPDEYAAALAAPLGLVASQPPSAAVPLPDLQRRVAEELVDGEELREGPGLRVGLLCGEDGVAEPVVVSARDLLHQGPVVDVRGTVDAQAAR
jgi:hypothetical protein